jgi:hypothetical protein
MSTPDSPPFSVTARGRGYLASAGRWAWLFAGMTLLNASMSALSVSRVWSIAEGMPLRARLSPFVTLLPTIGLSLVEVVLAVMFAWSARAFALGRQPRLAPSARAFRHLLIVFFVAGCLTLAGVALLLFARLRAGRD